MTSGCTCIFYYSGSFGESPDSILIQILMRHASMNTSYGKIMKISEKLNIMHAPSEGDIIYNISLFFLIRDDLHCDDVCEISWEISL